LIDKDLTLLNAIAPLDKKAKKQVWKDITGERQRQPNHNTTTLWSCFDWVVVVVFRLLTLIWWYYDWVVFRQ
jgi:hypothetical protein